ncbi:hypothetical protein GCM10029963_68500 [Micromonospora andamanensis]|uniref:hypothetical protein n=1 Tax=Micromonospora andamanensis TaxID=1287068 RepID=UPI001A3B63F3|nr:hypothetical protein [Micromonospora andamanensis]GIJ43111.1 hypothetical protein Vwe01_64360 [Micromonospora andamanensis]
MSTASRVLYEALAPVFTALEIDALDDRVFRDLVIARIVEPPRSATPAGLYDLGCKPASEKTMRRALTREHGRISRPNLRH